MWLLRNNNNYTPTESTLVQCLLLTMPEHHIPQAKLVISSLQIRDRWEDKFNLGYIDTW